MLSVSAAVMYDTDWVRGTVALPCQERRNHAPSKSDGCVDSHGSATRHAVRRRSLVIEHKGGGGGKASKARGDTGGEEQQHMT